MKDAIEMWGKYGTLQAPIPDDLSITGMHIDVKKEELRVYSDGVAICKLPLEDAVKALNEAWRTREVGGEELDDWEWQPETGEVK
jgi:hypothetical protein